MFALSNQPISYIMTIHFTNLIATYGGKEVKLTMRLFRDLDTDLENVVIWEDPLERQVAIMFQSFGKETVCKFYGSVYSFEKSKKESA